MRSCIYEGIVTHHRREPVVHKFQYRLAMVYLDLEELPEIVGHTGRISARKFAVRSFLRRDHLFEPARPLDDEVQALIEHQTGQRVEGPIRLLTQLRNFGYYMSPLNLFFVFDALGRRVEYIVAEVNNTPWNQRHCYLLWNGNRAPERDAMRFSHAKEFHVSPFMDMDLEYHWRVTEPDSQLEVQLGTTRSGEQLFDASMRLTRRELNPRNLVRMTLRYPLMTARIVTAIYYQALKLWWKKCPFYAHPDKKSVSPPPPRRSRRTMTASTSDR